MKAVSRHPRSAAFLLAQIGAHAAGRFAGRLSTVDLAPAHAGMLRALDRRPGMSQQELGAMLSVQPSRLVALTDELESRKLVERRDNTEDRRSYALHLTDQGRRALDAIGRIAREHDDVTCAALSREERAQLWELLCKIADEQGLTPGVHPGYRMAAAGKQRGGRRSD